MSKKKKVLQEATKLPDTDFLWGEALDAAFFTALTQRISTPIRNLPAFKMGLINAQGKMIKKPETKEERRAMSFVDQLALFMRQSMGGRTALLYNMYRQARMNPAFIQAAARAKSLRFLKYYDLRIGFFERPTPTPITGGVGATPTHPGKPFG
jgi:hypothetical protein